MDNQIPTSFAALTASHTDSAEPLWNHRTTTHFADQSGRLPHRMADMTWESWHQPGQPTKIPVTTTLTHLLRRAYLRGEA